MPINSLMRDQGIIAYRGLNQFVLGPIAAAYDKSRVFTIDNRSGETMYFRLDKLMVQLLEEIDPSSVPFVTDSGELIEKLDKALYGCLEASLLWYNHLPDVLLACGYKKNLLTCECSR